MKIGIAGPVSLEMLQGYMKAGEQLPEGYSFPAIAVLVEEYLRRGHRVSVFALDPTLTEPATFVGDQLTIHVGRFRRRHRARDFFSIERQDLLDAMLNDPCDLIHAHWTYEFALAALDSKSPCVVTAHDAPLRILQLLPHPYRLVRLLMAMKVTRKAQYITAVSPYLAKHFTRYLRCRKRIRVIPNGLPPALLNLKHLRIPRNGGGVVFATVLTGWNRRKNGTAALQAFKLVRSAIPNAQLIMFGPGYGRDEEAADWARGRQLDLGVIFAGSLPYYELLHRLATQVDILVHPALEESFGMVLAEGMALGLPVIGGSRSGAVPWTLGEGTAGILTDVRSPEELSEAMIRLATNKDLRESLGLRGFHFAWEHYAVDKVVDRYEDLFGEIL